MKREEEVAVAIAKREEEIMEAVRNREAEVDAACLQREELIKKEVDERIQWVLAKESELKAEEVRLEEVERELEDSAKRMRQQSTMATTTAKGSSRSLVQFFDCTHGFEIIQVGRRKALLKRSRTSSNRRPGWRRSLLLNKANENLSPNQYLNPPPPIVQWFRWKHPFRVPLKGTICPPL